MSKKKLSLADFSAQENKALPAPKTPEKPQNTQKSLVNLNRFSLLESNPSPTQTKVPTNFKEAVASSSTQNIPKITPSAFQYFHKNHMRDVHIIESEIYNPENPNLQETTGIMFRKEEYWISDNPLKTKKFYELILLDSQSAELEHTISPTDNSRISFSKCKILKVLTLSDWNQNPNTGKAFSIPFNPKEYTYYDYQQAWYNTFYIRSWDHSWFFIFKKNSAFRCPLWFNEWFQDFGICKEIMPTEYADGCTLFISKLKNLNMNPLIAYTATFGIPWIWTWHFRVRPGNGKIHYLVREFSVKWWHMMRPNQGNLEAVKAYFEKGNPIHAELSSTPNQFNFLTDKSKILSFLSEKTTKEEMKLALEKALSQISSHEDSDTEELLSGFTPNNGDDCAGIDFRFLK